MLTFSASFNFWSAISSTALPPAAKAAAAAPCAWSNNEAPVDFASLANWLKSCLALSSVSAPEFASAAKS